MIPLDENTLSNPFLKSNGQNGFQKEMFLKLSCQIENTFSSNICIWGYSLIQNELFVYILPDLVVASWYSVCGPTVWRKQISWHLQWILLILSFEESFVFFSIISSRLQLTPIEPVKKPNKMKKDVKQFQDFVPALCSCALCPPACVPRLNLTTDIQDLAQLSFRARASNLKNPSMCVTHEVVN